MSSSACWYAGVSFAGSRGASGNSSSNFYGDTLWGNMMEMHDGETGETKQVCHGTGVEGGKKREK